MIARIVRTLQSPGAVVFGILCSAYGVVVESGTGADFGTRPGVAISIDGILQLAADTSTSAQFEAFVVLPAWLLYLVGRANYSLGDPRRIRLGSHWRTAAANCRNGFATMTAAGLAAIGGWIVAALILAARTNPPSARTSVSTAPTVSWGCCMLMLVCEFIALSVALTVMELVLEALDAGGCGIVPKVALAACIWLWGALSASGLLPVDWTLGLNEYLDVAEAWRSPGLLVEVLALEVLTASACIAWLRSRDRVSGWQAAHAGLAIAGALGFVSLSAVAMTSTGATAEPAPKAVAFLLSAGSGTPSTALLSVIVYAGYAVAFQLRAGRELGGWAPLALIRYGSTPRFIRGTLGAETVRIVAYVGCVGAASVVVYIVAGGRDFATGSTDLGLWTYQLLVNGVLQVLVYVLLSFAGLLLTGSHLVGLATAGLLAALSWLPVPPAWLAPVQLSRLSLFSSGWPVVLCASAVLVGTLAMTYAVTVLLLRRARPHTR
jgi:hypothetical protein